MADEGPRPGGQRQLVGTATVRFTQQGANEVLDSGSRIQSMMQALLQSGTNLAQAAPMRSFAGDVDLARGAADEIQNVFTKFSEALVKQGGNFDKLTKSQKKYFKDAEAGTMGLIAAQVRYMNDNEEGSLLDEKRYKQLVDRVKIFRQFGDQLERVEKTSKEYNESFKSFKQDLDNINQNALPGLAKFVGEVFGEMLPKNLGDSTQAINAFKQGMNTTLAGMKKLKDIAFKLGKVLWKKGKAAGEKSILQNIVGGGTLKKAAGNLSNVGGAAAKAGGKLGGMTKSLGSLGSTAGTAGGTMARLGPMIASLGPYAIAAVAGIAILLAALAPLILAVGALVAGIKLGIVGIQKITQMQEEYRKTVYRSVGSIQELNKATAEMNRNTGLGTEAAMKATKALVEAGVSAQTLANRYKDSEGKILGNADALAVMGKSLMKFSSMTGVAEADAAKLQKTMLELSGGTDDGVIAMAEMVDAQKRFGLSGQDLSETMKLTNKMMSSFQYGLKGTNVNDFTKTVLELQGAAKQAGVSVQVATDFIDKMVNKVDDSALKIAAFSGRLNEYMTTSSASTMAEIGAQGLQEIEKFISRQAGNSQVLFQRISQNIGVTPDQMKMMKSYQAMMSDGERELFEEQQARNKLNEDFAKSMDTISMKLKQIFEPLIAMASEAVGPFVDELMNMGDFIKVELKPLWVELQLLMENIFGVRFGESSNLKKFLKAAIDVLTEIVRWGNMVYDVFEVIMSGIGELINFLIDAWNSKLKYVAIAALMVVNPVLGAAALAAGVMIEVSNIADKAADRNNRRRKLEEQYEQGLADRKVEINEEANQKQESQAEKYLNRLRQQQQRGVGLISEGLREAYRKRGYDPDKVFGSRATTAAEMTPTRAAAAATAAVARTSPSNPEVEAAKEAVQTAMMPTAKHTEDMKASTTGTMTDLINRIEEGNTLLAMIYEKTDPNTETMAEVMKEMAAQKTTYKSHRRAPTMGSTANQWGGENS